MAEDLGAAIEKIMKNPEFAGLVKELRGSDASVEKTSEDLLAKLPEVLEQLSPMLPGGESGKAEDASPPAQSGGVSELPPIISKGRGSFNKSNAERLLRALKPYLGERRCGIIDQCVSVMQISDLIGAAGMLEGLTGRK